MPQEKEIKIKLKIPIESFLNRLKETGYYKIAEFRQNDIYFDTRKWFLYRNLAALRFRKVEDSDYSFSFKKMFYMPNRNDKYYIEEIEVKKPFNETDKIHQIFNRLRIPHKSFSFKNLRSLTRFLYLHKYIDLQKMIKTRTVYKRENNEVQIDNVDKVGIIIELETENNDPLDIIKQILKNYEWSRSVEGTSYLWLKKFKNLNSHIENRKRFFKEPDWNVWDNEIEMYNSLNKSK